ncbi:very short patch repair endonuclease [Maricaulis sp.]|uniref:very short patch repair endonuclease n=1 Tax=Maricaulis sp. TaxID=1486257 RepID=UPI003A92CA29
MNDVVDSATRSRMMSGIKGKNTKPELMIRSGLHRLGFRFRLHSKDLPGKPDLVFAKYRAVIFVNGCFWHGHDCALFKWPSTRPEFWRAKIEGNRLRDSRSLEAIRDAGWRDAVIWECALKGRHRMPDEEVIKRLKIWLGSSQGSIDIRSAT